MFVFLHLFEKEIWVIYSLDFKGIELKPKHENLLKIDSPSGHSRWMTLFVLNSSSLAHHGSSAVNGCHQNVLEQAMLYVLWTHILAKINS